KRAVEKVFKQAKLTASLTIKSFSDWEDFLVLSRHIHDEDLFILISARRGATSYLSIMDNLPSKLEKHFPTNSRFVIYPQQYTVILSSDQYESVSIEPLNKGIEAVQKFGKGIGSI